MLLPGRQLHTCAACEQSGAKKESVRCMRCPVAYHTSCLPANCSRSFPGKRIICPKHGENSGRGRETDETRNTITLLKPTLASSGQRESDTTTRESAAAADNDDEVKEEEAKKEDVVMRVKSESRSDAKKILKSAKREKKKKKKRKKAAKREAKERGSWGNVEEEGDRDDRDDDDGDATRPAATRSSSEAGVKLEASDGELDDDNRRATLTSGLTLKREDSFTLSALHIAHTEAVSPATSSSLFESPATTNERIKARLVEALGQSDDDVESVGSPVTLPKLRVVRASSDGAVSSGNGSPAKTVESAASGDDDDDVDNRNHARAPPHSAVSSVETKLSPVGAGDNEVADSANDAASRNSQSSEEKPRPSKAERKSRHERSTLSKNLSREFKDAATSSDRRTSKKQPSQGFGDLSLQVPGSPAGSGERPFIRSAKDGISEGEEGDDEGPGDASTPTLRRRTVSGTPRGGEAISSDGTKARTSSSSRPSKKKKKKTKNPNDSLNDATMTAHVVADYVGLVHEKDATDAKWVQCDSCKKWRTVPKAIDLNAMPERWYCEMNTWDAAFASCAVDEEGAVDASATKQKSTSHSKKSKSRSKNAKAPASDPVVPTVGVAAVASDGGVSSPSPVHGSYASKATAVQSVAADVSGASASKTGGSKKPDKQSKKRKLKLKLKEKYREVKWVQCENAQCGKWRVVPSSIDFSLLPAVWFCYLNSWAPELAKCSAANPPEVEVFLMKSHSKKSTAPPPPSSSSGSRPSKKLKAGGEAAVSSPDGAAAAATALTLAGVTGDVPTKPPKPAKVPKGGVNPPVATSSQSSVVASGVADILLGTGTAGSNGSATSAGVSSGKGSNAVAELPVSSSSALSAAGKNRKGLKPMDGIKKTVLEWAQCEKCNKWRKLPQHIKSSTLPDKWFCSMNHWDPVRASCAVPEEVDQEPLGASPLPSSQNWYPMPGHIGSGAAQGGVRPKRSKLSYSELLYASTGHLRKTYTSESSTLSFEYNGRVYHRDDQYKDSSMYVCPRELLATAKGQLAASGSGSSASESLETGDATLVAAASEPSVEQVAALVLDVMDVRHSRTLAEIFRAANNQPKPSDTELSLSLVTAAVTHLVQKGLIKKHESENEADGESDKSSSRHTARVGAKRRRSSDALLSPPTARLLLFRKVPTRPLKASKCWKLGPAAFEFPLSND